MKNPRRFRHSSPRRILLILALLSATGTLAASERAIMQSHGKAAKRPAEAEFGLGPRASAQGRFLATLEADEPRKTCSPISQWQSMIAASWAFNGPGLQRIESSTPILPMSCNSAASSSSSRISGGRSIISAQPEQQSAVRRQCWAVGSCFQRSAV